MKWPELDKVRLEMSLGDKWDCRSNLRSVRYERHEIPEEFQHYVAKAVEKAVETGETDHRFNIGALGINVHVWSPEIQQALEKRYVIIQGVYGQRLIPRGPDKSAKRDSSYRSCCDATLPGYVHGHGHY